MKIKQPIWKYPLKIFIWDKLYEKIWNSKKAEKANLI